MTTDELIQFCEQKIENIKLKAEPQVFIEIKQALKELKAIKQWKSEVMEGFCKYDASSFEEIVAYARAKSIDEFAEVIKANYDFLGCIEEITFEEIDNIAEQLKDGGNDES